MNFALLLEDIKNYWTGIIIGILLLMLGFEHVHSVYLKMENAKLQASIEFQNAAILHWKQDAEIQTRRIHALALKNQHLHKLDDAKFKKLLDTKIPDCESALNLLADLGPQITR